MKELIGDIGILAGVLIIGFAWLKYKAEKRKRRQIYQHTKKALTRTED